MTSTEVAVPQQLVDVRTGELVPATPEKAIELLEVAREMRALVLSVVKDCEAVLLEASRVQGTKTLHFDRGTATVTGGQELAWDLSLLPLLLDAGLPQERYDELVTATVTYKVSAQVAKQLEAANEDYAEIIRAARGYVEKPFRVSVRS